MIIVISSGFQHQIIITESLVRNDLPKSFVGNNIEKTQFFADDEFSPTKNQAPGIKQAPLLASALSMISLSPLNYWIWLELIANNELGRFVPTSQA